MNYLILAETEFFALINGAGNGNNMEAAYNGFVESVISLCYGNGNSADAAIAMAYAENELQHHHTLYTLFPYTTLFRKSVRSESVV